jgi:hypothetical protein
MRYPGVVTSIGSTEHPALTVAAKLRIAVDLCGSGMDLQRERLRRAHPDASDAQIQERLLAWLRARPAAEDGDADGRPAPDRFRTS